MYGSACCAVPHASHTALAIRCAAAAASAGCSLLLMSKREVAHANEIERAEASWYPINKLLNIQFRKDGEGTEEERSMQRDVIVRHIKVKKTN